MNLILTPKLMWNHVSLWGLSVALSLGSTLSSATPSVHAGEIVRAADDRCVAVGRIILSWDSGIKNGTWVCEADMLNVGQNLRVDLLCLNQRFVTRLDGGKHQIAARCRSISNQPPRRCHSQPRLSCIRLRGGQTHATTPWLREPYGDTLAATPDTLEWQDVTQADSYRVYIEGEGKIWHFSTAQPILDLSMQSVHFQSGGTYLTTIVAMNQDQILSKSTRAFNLISSSRHQALQMRLQQLQSSSFSLTEQAHHTHQLYWDEGMYDQAMAHLEMLTHQYPGNPELLMLLGDRYSDMGRFDLAQQAYRTILAIPADADLAIAVQQALDNLKHIQQPS